MSNTAIFCIEEESQQKSLRTPAQEVSFPLSKDNRDLIERMRETLFNLDGVGLAAPQIGASKKIIAVYVPKDAMIYRHNCPAPIAMTFYLNARYEGIEEAGKEADWENCYSVKTRSGQVRRYKKIRLMAQTETGEPVDAIIEGFHARVLQHEIDHIEGVLIVDRFSDDLPNGSFEEMRRYRYNQMTDEQKTAFRKKFPDFIT